MEKLKELTTVLVEYQCDKCNEFNMEFNGRSFNVHPPLYEHQCRCGNKETYKKAYPYVDHVEKNKINRNSQNKM